LAEGIALTDDLDNAVQLSTSRSPKSNAPGGRNVCTTPRSCASKAECSRSRAIPKVPSGTFSPCSGGRAASRPNLGSSARHQSRPPVAERRQTPRRVSVARPRLRHQGFAGGEVSALRTRVACAVLRAEPTVEGLKGPTCNALGSRPGGSRRQCCIGLLCRRQEVVESSIIRRRRGLASTIGSSCLVRVGRTTQSLSDGGPIVEASHHLPLSRSSFI
jgi:hypothetical protein